MCLLLVSGLVCCLYYYTQDCTKEEFILIHSKLLELEARKPIANWTKIGLQAQKIKPSSISPSEGKNKKLY